ncbi:hypothetical protein TPHA_0A01110 [Tetrapisispora phaffii CBS 4417]|uniref:Metacaspase-1 n=1 Tax=Tetrapisispora phaffii (strain ATCC 24235 / CBS 4417 / NBRC 1672 / NRRL Y-8282 / UCD 70-5) TaxID=1071381 RepID=G8BMR7_TETPH|nr:hypothetical protein TPHA_0A01110 [Tetrapisispora phaffii CBS 4417]CCE61195.1 hypothetical protein TPHA_0A01110 [Tetrapisispora phaffii CBS 4417]
MSYQQGFNDGYNRPAYPPPHRSQYVQSGSNMNVNNGNMNMNSTGYNGNYNNNTYGNNNYNTYGNNNNVAQVSQQMQFQQQQQNQQQFQQQFQQQNPNQYQNRAPRRKALLIGINYLGSKNQLRGCINDVSNMYAFLTSQYGYNAADIVRLTDDQTNMVCVPTRANMIRAMHWLVKDAQPGDSLFFHYSGHGGQTEDLDGDEDNGYDETIMPVDFQTQGVIVDDEMNAIMVKPLPAGVKMTCLFDSCHSGTALDLPFTYSTKGVIKEPSILKNVGSTGLEAVMAYASGNRSNLMTSINNLVTTVSNGANGMSEQDKERIKQMKMSPADIIMISGSKDNQTSADAVENGNATGAMSYAFIKVLSYQPQQTYLSMLNNMRNELVGKYSQKPQLSASHEIDVNQRFII